MVGTADQGARLDMGEAQRKGGLPQSGELFGTIVSMDRPMFDRGLQILADRHGPAAHGGQIVHDGLLFGSYYRTLKGWAAVDLATGKVRYRTEDLPMGSVLWADGRLYVLSQEGDVALLKPTDAGFEFTGRFRLIPQKRQDVWPHPAILGGRLFLRYHDSLWCYDIRK